MLKYLIENSDLKAILQFGPQNFFKAVDLLKTLEVVNRVRKNSKDDVYWAQVCARSRALLDEAGGELRWAPSSFESQSQLLSLSKAQGEGVLYWFFYQIFQSEDWVIDFRRKSWSMNSEGMLLWSPKPLYFKPSDDFKKGGQNLYLGFYQDQPEVFTAGVEALGIQPARETLVQHFGQGDQSAVEFHLRHLESTFAQVFAKCAQSRVHVHPEFAALGVMLLGLYETFESAGLSLNVREVFKRALKTSRLKVESNST